MSAEESDRLEFDRLTNTMGEIHSAQTEAPEEHGSYYAAALLTSYANAFEFLKDHPELHQVLVALGKLATAMEETELSKTLSVARLTSYAEAGMVDASTLAEIEDPSVPRGFVYSRQQIASYADLFTEPMTVKEERLKKPGQRTKPKKAHQELEPGHEDEVSDLDVIEHLIKRDFSDARLAFIRCSLGNNSTSLHEMRRQEWDLTVMSNEEFEEFRLSIPEIQNQASQLLGDVGVASKWLKTTGSDKTLAYQLLVGAAATAVPETDTKARLKEKFGDTFDIAPHDKPLPDDLGAASEAKTNGAVLVEAASEVSLVTALMGFEVKKVISIVHDTINNQGEDRFNMVVRSLSERLNITRLEGRQMIRGLIGEELIFRNGTRQNAYLLSMQRPTQSIRQLENNDNTTEARAAEKAANELVTAEELPIARQIFIELKKVRYQSKGLTVPNLSKLLGVSDETTKLVCSKLVRQNLLDSVARRVKSGSPRSKANRIASFMMFPTQNAWNDYKDDPEEYIGRVKLLEEQPD